MRVVTPTIATVITTIQAEQADVTRSGMIRVVTQDERGREVVVIITREAAVHLASLTA